MTVVSKKSCISISFCYFYSFSSVNFRCREGEYFNRYVRIQTEYQSSVYCPKNKKIKNKKRVVLQNLHIACWKCWLCYWVSWNFFSCVQADPSRSLALELVVDCAFNSVCDTASNGLAVRITFLMLLSACKDSDFHISTAWQMLPTSLCSGWTTSKVLASLKTRHAVTF